jgi:hypothetical protein
MLANVMKHAKIALCAGLSSLLLLAVPVSAQTPEQARIDELERRVRELESRVRELLAATPSPKVSDTSDTSPAAASTPEVADTSDTLADKPDLPEVSHVADSLSNTLPPQAQPVPSLGPPRAADETAAVSRTGPISGYMDFHLNKPEHEDAIWDFHRFVLLFNHSFTDRIRFIGELELEHAFVSGLEASGEVELEQAYVDFKVKPQLNLRAGMLLTPVGIINERHEPPSFFGVERPFVDTFIIPTTWFDAGAGVHGTIGNTWQYRGYLMAPLDATKITAEEGLHEATQKGFESNVRDVALTGRVENVRVPGLNLGASFWRGKTGFNFRQAESSVGLLEFDGRYRAGMFAARGEFAQVFVGGAAELNDFLQRTAGVSPNIARQMRGFYLEPSLRPLPKIRQDIGAFLRYENFDTQYRMPAGLLPLKQFDRTAWIFGGNYYPDPDVVLKVDYSIVRNRSSLFGTVDSFNIGLGWWF